MSHLANLYTWFRGRLRTGSGRKDLPRPDTCVAIIGDVHGRADLLAGLMEKLDRQQPAATRVFVGDYIDRGPSSRDVLEMLQAMAPSDICLLGNHEAMMLDFLESPIEKGARWLRNGGLATLASYAVTLDESSGHQDILKARDALERRLQDGTLAWLGARPLWWQSGNLLVAHAGADPALPIANQPGHNFLWGHKRFLRDPRPDGLWVAHGHWARDRPTVGQARVSVDTGAWKSGCLTAAVIDPDGGIRFVQQAD